MHAPQPTFRLLGPLEVWADGAPLRLGGERQRALLALLLFHANEVVPSDRLIEQLFGLDAPETAANALQVAVSRLRRLLADGALVTRPRGYVLQVEPDELDSALFEQLVEDGRHALADGDPLAGGARLREALALWRGPALADLAQLEALQPEIRRLEELRVAAVTDRVDADLALGRGAELVPELEGLVNENPLDERLRGLQMRALYRAGRQADALDVYRQTREVLRDELGLAPSPALQQLEREILNHDPALDRPPDPAEAPAAPTPEPSPAGQRRRRRAPWIAAACAGVLVLAAGAYAGTRALDTTHGLSAVDANSIGLIDPGHHRIAAQRHLAARPVGVAVEGNVLWIATADGAVSRVDPDHLDTVNSIAVDSNPGAITASPGAVWVADQDTGMVTRIDPVSRHPVGGKIRVGNGPSAAAFGGGMVWIANSTDGSVSRIDPDSDAPAKTFPVGTSPSGVVYAYDSVWVADAQEGTVTRIDPNTGVPSAKKPVGAGPAAITAGLGAVWVASSLDGTVSRINPATNGVTTSRVGAGVDSLTIADGSVWAGDAASGTVFRLDPATGSVVGRVHVSSSPASLAAVGDRLVVATVASRATHRGGTLVAVAEKEPPAFGPLQLDPTRWGLGVSTIVLGVTNNGLVANRRVGGTAALVVVPDLATSLPVPSRGSTVQTFVLRPGLRYSDGRPVHASDVRASIERFWRMNPSAAGDFPEIRLGLVDEPACIAHTKHCDLSHGIVTDDRTGAVSFHLARPSATFLRVLAVPFFDLLPAGTPARPGLKLPATGPYRIAKFDRGRRVVLERNPRYLPRSTGAQPGGFADRIVFRLEVPVDRALAGRADFLHTVWPLPRARVEWLATHRASRLHPVRQIGLATTYLFMNNHVPPFDRHDARTALSYAIDRNELLRVSGGPLVADTTCQVIPLSFSGYSPYCPFARTPAEAGTWGAPDIERARALVRRSGTLGMKVVVWTGTSKTRFGRSLPPQARYIVHVLNEIGYDASLKTVHLTKYYPLVFNPNGGVNVGLSTWATAIPDTASFIRSLLGCPAVNNLARFCDPDVERLISRAAELEVTDQAGANRLWTAIDRKLVDAAPWVPIDTPRWTDVVSPRLGNYQSSTALGFLVDQAWVR